MVALPTQPPTQKNNEWYTKAKYIEAARLVMGGIDLDPASCAAANQTVKAERYYTEQDNGLLQPWVARSVWLNPPYTRTLEMRGRHQSTIALFSGKLLTEYNAGNISQAILLVSVQVDAKWFQPLWQFPICFVDHKLKFNMPFKRNSYSFHMFGTAFVYLGTNEDKFIEVFSQFGTIAKRVSRPKSKPVNLSLWEGS